MGDPGIITWTNPAVDYYEVSRDQFQPIPISGIGYHSIEIRYLANDDDLNKLQMGFKRPGKTWAEDLDAKYSLTPASTPPEKVMSAARTLCEPITDQTTCQSHKYIDSGAAMCYFAVTDDSTG